MSQAGAEQRSPFRELAKASFIARQFALAVCRVLWNLEAAGKGDRSYGVPYSTGAHKL